MRWDSLVIGFVAGMVLPVAGFFIYGLLYTNVIRPHLDLDFFVHDLFFVTRRYQAPILSLSLIANLPVFFLFDRLDMPKAMRGMITATFVYAVAIVVLWM
jgi:hypothetical protein